MDHKQFPLGGKSTLTRAELDAKRERRWAREEAARKARQEARKADTPDAPLSTARMTR